MIDVHCHIHDEVFDNDREEVISRAKEKGVKHIIISAVKPEEVSKALNIVNSFKEYMSLTIGHDPVIVSDEVFEEQLKNVKKYLDIIVGIGEAGLDYYFVRDHGERDRQRRIFALWINVAKELDLPLVIHSRSAGKYAIEILLEQKYFNVVMHAYDGSVGWAIEAAKHGVYFSIPPSVIFSIQKQKLVRKLPLENLLLETDSPVLSPIRGERNEPANIVYSAMKIAEIKNISLSKVIDATIENTLDVFKKLKLQI
ncbi:MAG: hypothetical protein DRO23_04155 [Thermoprotei archaeon]|nr:MAG: hypothetical protein DRO23_04155 [Thermoprotei archaeon]